MTDQPKPQVSSDEDFVKNWEFMSQHGSTQSAPITFKGVKRFVGIVRAALAEVERLRNELATTSKGSMTVERMQEQLAQVTAERDDWKFSYEREGELGIKMNTIHKSQLLASAAENVLLREALEKALPYFEWKAERSYGLETDDLKLQLSSIKKALSSTPTALVKAIADMRDALQLAIPDVCSRAHSKECHAALAAYDDALKSGSK